MKRICMLMLALVLALALAACDGAAPASQPDASGAPAQSAPAGVPESVPADAPSSAPASAPAAPASEAAPVQAVSNLEGFAEALDGCVMYGPGEAGCSLKEAIAACGLLDFAQREDITGAEEDWSLAFEQWLREQDEFRQELFWLNWPGLQERVEAIGADPAAYADLLSSAGDPNGHDSYQAEKYLPMLAGIQLAAPAELPSEEPVG